jgi:hypothetical protein
VGAHATPGPRPRRSAKEASMWVSLVVARQLGVGLELPFFLLIALSMD